MATNDKPDSLVVLESFVGYVDGQERIFRQGDPIRLSDPAAKKWPEKFGPVHYAHEPRIEAATAAPGEKR